MVWALLPLVLVLAAAPALQPQIDVALLSLDGKTTIAVSGCVAAAPAGADKLDWQSMLTIRVAGAPADAPALAGRYRWREGQLHFVPRFPLQAGLDYEVAVDSPLCGLDAEDEAIRRVVSLEAGAKAPSTRVVRVEPGADRLPENQLKFYLFFSAPMSQGQAYGHIRLLDEAGRPVDLPFLEIEPELWDRQGRRLTLLFDPGRVKRELLPNRQVGPPLVEGRRYILQIDRNWPDASGASLEAPFEKNFTVGPPDRQPPDPADWTLSPGSSGSLDPLVASFPEPLDGGLLRRQLQVVAPTGESVSGRVELSDHETRWLFYPDRPWRPGRYRLVIGTLLEDLAGNSIGRAFEVDRFDRVEARVLTETVSLTFEVGPVQR